jgi:hypothetical protein
MKSKFNYQFIHTTDTSRIVLKTNEVSLPDLLDQIRYFLEGCGFTIDGRIEIVEED